MTNFMLHMQQSFAGQLFGFERAQLPAGTTLRWIADARLQISNRHACCPG
jgi:hypothetical protein